MGLIGVEQGKVEGYSQIEPRDYTDVDYNGVVPTKEFVEYQYLNDFFRLNYDSGTSFISWTDTTIDLSANFLSECEVLYLQIQCDGTGTSTSPQMLRVSLKIDGTEVLYQDVYGSTGMAIATDPLLKGLRIKAGSRVIVFIDALTADNCRVTYDFKFIRRK